MGASSHPALLSLTHFRGAMHVVATPLVNIPCKKVVSWERYKRKPEVIQLPLLGLDGDHTPAGEALG